MATLPPPGTTVDRVTARVLPVDRAGRVLLMHGWEPNNPARTFWFTIGGALEEGEEPPEAAVRELAEEVGIVVEPELLSEPLGTWSNAFSWGDWHIRQQETWFAVAVDDAEVSLAGLDELEQQTTDRAGWWSPEELEADGTAVIPELAERMRAAIVLVRGGAGSS
jgi:8-oxo-dGTP pyrophosphatase MutT (NUDIX family)